MQSTSRLQGDQNGLIFALKTVLSNSVQAPASRLCKAITEDFAGQVRRLISPPELRFHLASGDPFHGFQKKPF
jgi:hypothetical protein